MKHFFKLCVVLFIALFFIACKNAAGPEVPSENLEGSNNGIETTPESPATEDETGLESTGEPSEDGTGETGADTDGETGTGDAGETDSGDITDGDTGSGDATEGGTGSGGATDGGTGSGGSTDGNTGSGSTDGSGGSSDGDTDGGTGSGGSTDGTGSGGSTGEGTGSEGDDNSNSDVVIPDGYTVILDKDLAIDLNNNTGHTLTAHLPGKVSGNWNISNGNFNDESPTLTLDTNTYDYSQIMGIIEQAVYFEHTSDTSAYENVTMDSTKITENKTGVKLVVTLQANENYIFEDGKPTKDIHIIFDIVIK